MDQRSHSEVYSPVRGRRRLVSLAVALVLSGFVGRLVVADSDQESKPIDVEPHISALVLELGSAEPLVREHAEDALVAQGMLAFEALQDAATHEDIEIRLRAQRILERLRKTAMHLEIEPALELYLKDIWSQAAVRRLAMFELALRAEPVATIPAACQVVRFEKSELTSKRLAAAVMNQLAPTANEGLVERQRMILDAIGASRRDACRWLGAYARSLTDHELPRQQFAVMFEEEQQRRQFDREDGNLPVIQTLREVQLDMMLRAGQQEEFQDGVRAMVKDHLNTRTLLWQLTEWLLDRGQAELVVQLGREFEDPFQKDRLLLYRMAAAALRAGDATTAEQLALQSREIDLRPTDAHRTANALLQELNPSDRENHGDAEWVAYHIGDTLLDLGMFAWGERELRRVIDAEGEMSKFKFFAITTLAESLHDRGEHAAAAGVLQVLGEGIEANSPEILQVFQDLIQEPGETAARWRFFRARGRIVAGDLTGAQEDLRIAIANSAADSDVLIAMFRMPDASPDWKSFTRQQIQRSVANYRVTIREAQSQRAERSQPIQQALIANYQLSQALNQFAWLVGNTEGDIDEAIRMSRESMQADAPSGSQLDTLGRCYYRAGDVANALRCQQQAVRLLPHSMQIRKQLELFESEAQAHP